jgi:hypothetical protein
MKMIGCYSHRLNLAVKKHIKDKEYGEIINKINDIIIKYKIFKLTGILRKRCFYVQKLPNPHMEF